MNPALAAALVAGGTLGLGLWLLASAVPRIGRPRLEHRLAPYLVDVSPVAAQLATPRRSDPLPVLGALLAPLAERGTRLIESVLGGEATIRTRLRQSGSAATVGGHRTRQLVGAVLGAAAGAALGVVAGRESLAVIPVAIVGLGAGAIAGIALVDALLARAAKRRSQRIAQEFPTVVEFLALSVAAGESIVEAMRRVARTGSGELAGELDRVVSRQAAGQPIAEGLAELRDELAIPSVARLVDQVLAAIERGTPLTEVLRAQAADARDDAKRSLLEAAGTREVAMLIPLVFLILPVTVMFAIYPGLLVLQFGF
ncbi:MAG: type II secretion system F family protein [Microcella sp.]